MNRFLRNVISGLTICALTASSSLALAGDTSPVSFRGVGGAVMGGTWNVAFTGIGILL